MAGTASGPSVLSLVSSAKSFEPEHQPQNVSVCRTFPFAERLRLQYLMVARTGSINLLKIRGLGWVPFIMPRRRKHAALFMIPHLPLRQLAAHHKPDVILV